METPVVAVPDPTGVDTKAVVPNGFLDALHAEGPDPSVGAAAAVYDWLIGSWEADVVDYEADGTRHESRGEWHFGWVLEGRAVQDVWIAPPRQDRTAPPGARNRYGTSIRIYDRRTGDWLVIWHNPVSGAEVRLVGKRVGDDVVQAGFRDDGTFIRWIFTDIASDSFTWRGEASIDGGRTWYVEAEFFARRMGTGVARAGDGSGHR